MKKLLLNLDLKYRKKNLGKYKSGISLLKKSVTGFDKYIYVNADTKYAIPFRMKKAKAKNSPVFIYCPGSASNGHKNIFNLVEFFAKMSFTGLFSKDCNIIVPQAVHETENSEQSVIDFCCELSNLKSGAVELTEADTSRIYITGTSLGGFVVWYSLLLFPSDYTAAVAVEGAFIGSRGKTRTDIEKLADTPLWVAHAANDKCVDIESDDKMVDALKATGADVIYTRTEKHGHKMSIKFYKTQPFIKWLFKQKKAEH